ncbi:MAG: hypothetical protein DRH32_05385 [Deltaproteobacteria bacterium]|nr:MAG: hypothetical protein DRH32_05385 [Deltaproteobacteria bacterium]
MPRTILFVTKILKFSIKSPFYGLHRKLVPKQVILFRVKKQQNQKNAAYRAYVSIFYFAGTSIFRPCA